MWPVSKARANPAVLLLAVVVSLFLTVRFVVPYSTHLFTTTLPSAWIVGREFLVQPYLFFLLNFIIVVIWMLSERHAKHSSSTYDKQCQQLETPPPLITLSPRAVPYETAVGFSSPSALETTKSVHPVSSVAATCDELDAEYEFAPADITLADDLNYKAPIVPEDESLSELKTMDATWESIMAVTPTRNVLEKSETRKEATRVVENFKSPTITDISKENADRSKMKKSDTVKKATSRRRAPVRRMEIEEIGSAELNLQYEAFIKRRHKQLLLEKQESNQRYIDMMMKTGVQIIDN